MQRKRKFAFGASLATTAALAMTLTGGAGGVQASTPPAHPHTGNASVPARVASGTPAPWTAARMAHAKNLDVLPTLRGGPSKMRALPRRMTVGAPRTVAPALGSLHAAPSSGAVTTQTDGIATKFRRPYRSFVERTNAKVFFVQDGGDYVCSGTIVNSSTKNMVNTAGHCLSDGFGGWSSDIVVVPAYSSRGHTGNAPFGAWTGKTWATTNAWLYDSDLNMDYGYILLHKHERHNIVRELGGRGVAWNYDWIQHFTAMGYPQAFPFDGMSQWKDHGTSLWLDDPMGMGETPTIALLDNLTGGSSGGAWDINLGGKPYVNGHNDYKYTDDDSVMYSPYYGSDEESLYDYAVGLNG